MHLTQLSFVSRMVGATYSPCRSGNAKNLGLMLSAGIILGMTYGGIHLITRKTLKSNKSSIDLDQSSRIQQISKPVLSPEESIEVQSSVLQLSSVSHSAINVPNLEESQLNIIKEIYSIHQKLVKNPTCCGWLKEHINTWSLNRELIWSMDYLNHTKNYLLHLLRLKNKSTEELETFFERGLKAHFLLKDPQKLPAILTGEVWFSDGIHERNLLIEASMLDSTKNAIPILLKAGVDPNQRDTSGNTPLHWSIANAAVGCAMVLIQHAQQYQIDFDVQDWSFSYMTPLQLAISKGRRNSGWDYLVESLIANTKYLNKQNKRGNTALHLACVRRDLPYVKALREAGANFTIRNKDGKTPKDLWSVSTDDAWKILEGCTCSTTLDREERERVGDFPQEFN